MIQYHYIVNLLKHKELNPNFKEIIQISNYAVTNSVDKIQGNCKDVKNISPGGLKINDLNMITIDAFIEKYKVSKVNYIKFDIECYEQRP